MRYSLDLLAPVPRFLLLAHDLSPAMKSFHGTPPAVAGHQPAPVIADANASFLRMTAADCLFTPDFLHTAFPIAGLKYTLTPPGLMNLTCCFDHSSSLTLPSYSGYLNNRHAR